MKRTTSARADGVVCIGREAVSVPVGRFLINICTGAVPHNITLFVEFKITIVPESICGLFIDQRSKVLPVVVIPQKMYLSNTSGGVQASASQPPDPH